MFPRMVPVVLLAWFLTPAQDATAQVGRRGDLISKSVTARYGLTRAWFTQVQLDPARDAVRYVTLHNGTLFVQTSGAVVHSIDAETGRTNWAQMLGETKHPSTAVGANDKYCAVVNGMWLYVVERAKGRPVWRRKLGGVPGAGPALTDEYVFVPMLNGRVEGYQLERDRQPPWVFASAGKAVTQPWVSKNSICWPTNRGHMYVGRPQTPPSVRFRFEAFDEIVTPPAYAPPYLMIGGRDGYLSAVHEKTGAILWDFSTGDEIVEPALVIGDNVYVAAKSLGLFCVSARSGQERWSTPGPTKVLAGSKSRIYATDRLGRMMILDSKTGGRVSTMDTSGLDLLLVNRQTDRIYLGTRAGMLLCLHELGAKEPTVHLPSEEEFIEAPPPGKAPPKPAGGISDEDPFKKGGAADNPFATPKAGGGGAAENPFAPSKSGGGGAAADNPFGGGATKSAAKDDNPFGGGAKQDDAKKDDNDNPFN